MESDTREMRTGIFYEHFDEHFFTCKYSVFLNYPCFSPVRKYDPHTTTGRHHCTTDDAKKMDGMTESPCMVDTLVTKLSKDADGTFGLEFEEAASGGPIVRQVSSTHSSGRWLGSSWSR